MNYIKIKEEDLKQKIKETIKNAEGFEWSGWKLPIFLNIDGGLCEGSWHSNGYFIGEDYHLVDIESWHSTYDPDLEIDTEDWDKENWDVAKDACVQQEIEDHIDYYIEKIKADIYDCGYPIEII